MSRCTNCSILLAHPIRKSKIREASDSMVNILRSWLFPTAVSEDDFICGECYIILERASASYLRGPIPAQTFGHRQLCLSCGKSVFRTKSHIIPLNSPEGNFIFLYAPREQVHRLERVCLRCWSYAYRSVRRLALQDVIAEPDAVSSTNEEILHLDIHDSMYSAKSEETVENVAEKEEMDVEGENEDLFEIPIHLKTEAVEETDASENTIDGDYVSFTEDWRNNEDNNLPRITAEIVRKPKKNVARRKKETIGKGSVTCSAKVYENALATAVSKIIARVYNFFKKEFEYLSKRYGESLDLHPFVKYEERTAEATGFNVAVVKRALREEGERENTSWREEGERRKIASRVEEEREKTASRLEGEEEMALRGERERENTGLRVEGKRGEIALRVEGEEEMALEEGERGKTALRVELEEEMALRWEGERGDIASSVEEGREETGLKKEGEGGEIALKLEGEEEKTASRVEREEEMALKVEGQRGEIVSRVEGEREKTDLRIEGRKEKSALRARKTRPRKRCREENRNDSRRDSQTDSCDETFEFGDDSGTTGTPARQTPLSHQHIPRINKDHAYAIAPAENTAIVKNEPSEELQEPEVYASPTGISIAYDPLRQMAAVNDPLKVEPDNFNSIEKPRRQLKAEERKEKKKLLERIRKTKIKNDPVLREQHLRKDRERLARRREAGLIPTRSQMNEHARQIARKKNRISARAYYWRKKAEENAARNKQTNDAKESLPKNQDNK